MRRELFSFDIISVTQQLNFLCAAPQNFPSSLFALPRSFCGRVLLLFIDSISPILL